MITIVRRNMKRASVFQWILATALFTVSCTTDVWNETEDDANAICFQAPQTESRAAVEGSSLPAKSSFLVWGGYDNNVTNVFNGETVSESNGVWNYEGGTRYWIPGKTYSFYGVYPSETSATVEDGIIKVNGFNTNANYGEQAVDLMTAVSPVMSGGDAQQVPLNFSHELCKVRFTVKAEPGIPTTTVQKVILYGYTGQGNFSTGTSPRWTLDGIPYTNADSPLKFEGNESLTDTHPIEGEEWLLIPQAAESLKLDFSYTQNGIQKEWPLDLTSNGKVQWNAGKAYHYVVTVKSNAISFAQFVIDEWRTSSAGGEIVIP